MIRMNEAGLTELANRLNSRYKRGVINSRMRTVIERLAEYGIRCAAYHLQHIESSGPVDVTIGEPRWIDKETLEIPFTGETVAFLEFGTGIVYTDDHPEAGRMGAIRGEYGFHQGRNRTWYYFGDPGSLGEAVTDKPGLVRTHGNPANKFILHSAEDIRKKVMEIVSEVFV